MNKRILSVVLVLVLMLSMATTAFAAQTETYYLRPSVLAGDPVELEIPNATSQGRVKLGEKEILEYLRGTEYLDNRAVWVFDFGGGELDDDTDYTRSLRTLGEAIEYENLLGGVPVYNVGGPVVITAKDALATIMFFWKDANIETTYKAKYYDADEYDNVYDTKGLKVHDTAPESWVLAPGTTAGLTEPGKYLFFVGTANRATAGVFAVHVGDTPTTPVPTPAPNATPTSSTVLVNNAPVNFEAYTIEGNNYFKLRDLAQVVNNTDKSFEVTWDGTNNAINLISNTAYTPVGGELAKGESTAKNATPTTSKIYKDGVEITLKAYTINNNNFFKLRDIAEAFDIGVTWDNATKTIGIDTSIGYTAE